MALINCPECGETVSDKAVSCPKCAYPITAHSNLVNSNQRKIQTIELTLKKHKISLLLASIPLVGGFMFLLMAFVVAASGNASGFVGGLGLIGIIGIIIGIIWLIIIEIRIWRHHDG